MKISIFTKWILLLVFSVGMGTFIYENILNKLNINVWFARSGGALATALIALALYYFLKLGKTNECPS
ncbi:MAG: hypothetical protein VB108_02910 [Anaerolineaceae bacterium]|nr:hypothetical protein [Anaerolineaceae bacterium]